MDKCCLNCLFKEMRAGRCASIEKELLLGHWMAKDGGTHEGQVGLINDLTSIQMADLPVEVSDVELECSETSTGALPVISSSLNDCAASVWRLEEAEPWL